MTTGSRTQSGGAAACCGSLNPRARRGQRGERLPIGYEDCSCFLLATCLNLRRSGITSTP